MGKWFVVILALLLQSYGVRAEGVTDSEANEYLLASCETSRVEIIRELVQTMESLGLTHSASVDFGYCSLQNAKATLHLPQVINTSEFSYQGQPFPMAIKAVNKEVFGWPLINPEYDFL